jgi:hypothetical protein
MHDIFLQSLHHYRLSNMFESSSFSHGGHRSFNFPSSGQNFQWGGDLTPSPLSGATPLPEDPFVSGNSHGQCIPQPVFHQVSAYGVFF